MPHFKHIYMCVYSYLYIYMCVSVYICVYIYTHTGATVEPLYIHIMYVYIMISTYNLIFFLNVPAGKVGYHIPFWQMRN